MLSVLTRRGEIEAFLTDALPGNLLSAGKKSPLTLETSGDGYLYCGTPLSFTDTVARMHTERAQWNYHIREDRATLTPRGNK